MDFIKNQKQLRQAREQRGRSEGDLFKAKESLEKTRREKSRLSRIAGKGHNQANARIKELSIKAGESGTQKLNKGAAHKLIFRLKAEISSNSD